MLRRGASESTGGQSRLRSRAIHSGVTSRKDGKRSTSSVKNSLNLRLTQRGPLVGPAENFTFAQLETSVRLLHGEKIPSLEQFLDAVVTQTTLKFVYVDCKPTIAPHLATVAAIQQAALAKASSLGRDVQIYLAITTDDILNEFVALHGYRDIPTICELGTDKLEQANSHVWSPRWTNGTPSAEIAALHGEGRIVITWTVNVPSFIEAYAREGGFDGMLSDYPGFLDVSTACPGGEPRDRKRHFHRFGGVVRKHFEFE